jgi:uncharacterized protein YbjT (DUF2867 family)
LLDGVTALFLHPRAVADPVAVLARARDQGVRKVVALSAMNVDDPLGRQPSRLAGDRNKENEDAAVASGLRWTSLRPSTFARHLPARSTRPTPRWPRFSAAPALTYAQWVTEHAEAFHNRAEQASATIHN